MKKIIAIVLALTALTVSAFASATPEPAPAAAPAAQAAAAEETGTDAASRGKGASTEIEAALTKEDAVAAALKDAGFAAEDVTVTRTRLRETEDETGAVIAVYTVKFHTEDTTYKVHVDANTGKVLDTTVTEGVSEGRSRGGRTGASGEMGKAASGEPAEDASVESSADGTVDAETSASVRSGRGRRACSTESDASAALEDTTAA